MTTRALDLAIQALAFALAVAVIWVVLTYVEAIVWWLAGRMPV